MGAVTLADARALVTGGAGFVGSHLADVLLAHGAREVIALDNFVRGRPENLADAARSGRLTVVEGDIRDRLLLDRLMDGVDVVFHQAAIRITQCAEEPELAMEVLVHGTFNVVAAAAQAGVSKVVAASSASVYGSADRFPTDESQHPYNNRTLYGAAKAFNEGLLRAFHEQHGLAYVALRYFNVYGPRMDVHGAYTEVFIRWMERLAAGEAPVVHGDGTQTMDFVHVRDVARANVLAASMPVDDAVFNVGTGVETRLDALAALLARLMGADAAVAYAPSRRVNGVTRRQADVSRAARDLGFRAAIPLDEGLADLVAWWKHQREPQAVRA